MNLAFVPLALPPAISTSSHASVRLSSFVRPAAHRLPVSKRSTTRFPYRATPTRFSPSCNLPSVQLIASSVSSSIAGLVPISVSIALLGSVVAFHEYGHFQAAKLQGIKVKEYSIGFGPIIFSREGADGTTFTLRLLPLGGFVAFPENKILDDDGVPTDELSTDPDLLQNRPALDRAIVISAGVAANLVMAYASLLLSTNIVGQPHYDAKPGVVISSIVDGNGAGARANLLPGDIILALDGRTVPASIESATGVASTIRSSGGRVMDFHLKRGGGEVDLKVQPNLLPSGDSAIGVQLLPNASVSRERPASIPKAISATNADFSRVCSQTWAGFLSLFKTDNIKNLSGPVGVVATGANLATNEKASLLSFIAVISINVALLNALPLLPALDGGQLLFLGIEVLRGGKAVPARFQDAANSAAFFLLIGLSGVIFLNDIEKLSVVQSIKTFLG